MEVTNLYICRDGIYSEYECRSTGGIERVKRTIVFVYVLGKASKNHNPKPLTKPFPSLQTISRTRRPSSLATATLNTVRRTRKKEWRARMRDSWECHVGKVRRRMERRWLRVVVVRVCLVEGGEGEGRGMRRSRYKWRAKRKGRGGVKAHIKPKTTLTNCVGAFPSSRTSARLWWF